MGSGLAIREKERELSWIRTKAKERRVKALNHYLPREWVGKGGGGLEKCDVFFFFFFNQNFSLPHLLPNNFI